jgi:Transglutaminase-like superfamily
LQESKHRMFRMLWRGSNLLLVLCAMLTIYAIGWEFSVRQYLHGFSDAIVSSDSTPEEKVDAILGWMKDGPARASASNPGDLSKRDPETTLNYQQLLDVCGTATNAFLNLARSSGLRVRRLLLLTPDRNTKHVVAEVFLDDRWIVVDPTYRFVMKNADGRMLTRQELRDPQVFAQAVSKVPGYPMDYNYKTVAHVRVARIPLEGFHLRRLLDFIFPGWDEAFDWSLLLERESFFVLFCSLLSTFLLLLWRFMLGWYADRRLKIPRFHLRRNLLRAGTAFLTTPEIK